MNYNHLRYFSVLAELEHYTLAADTLGISQPSLSNAMHALEEALGVTLFEKQGRNIRLTRYGRMYKEYVDKALLELDNGQRLLRRSHEIEMRLIRVGHVSSATDLLMPAMRAFLKVRPEAYFQLTENPSLLLLDQLRDQKLDMALCATKLPDRAMRFQALGQQRLLAAVAPEHPLAVKMQRVQASRRARETEPARESSARDASRVENTAQEALRASLAEIAKYPLVGYHHDSGMHALIEQLFRENELKSRFICEVGSESAALRCAADGMGVAIVSDAQMTRYFPVQAFPIADANRTLYLCTLVDKWLSPIAWSFSESLAQKRR